MTSKTRCLCLIVVGTVLTMLVGAHLRLEADTWYMQKGLASWYGNQFDGRQTASGTVFSQKEMTAAHRKLPLGTKVMVENLQTGAQVEVKVTDRGPYADQKRRIIDLSHAAADSIGLVHHGVGHVRVIVTEPAPEKSETGKDFNYEVQVGAFEEYEAAQWVFEQLRERYPAAFIDPRESPAGRYYRVRIGPFENEEQAEKVAKILKRQGHRIFVDEVSAPSDVAWAQ